MKPPSKTADRIFGFLLGVCLATLLGGGIAWALGWEEGLLVMLVAGAFAYLPLFHFAMHWPFREKRNSKKSSLPEESGPR